MQTHDTHGGHGPGSGGHAAHGAGKHRGGHDAHAGHGVAMFRERFWLSLLLSVPVLIWSEMLQDLLGFTAPNVPGDRWIPLVFGTAVFLYGGSPFLRGGWSELRHREPGMMLLISLAITVAFGSSLASEADLLDLDFWWELALLIDVMLLGHWQEMKAIGQASSALDALAALLPDMAERVEGAGTTEVAITDLRPGDFVLVRPGGRVPADGTIASGEAAFDEAMISGESRPVQRAAGDRVVAGTVATDSSVRLRVEAVGDDTALAGIRRLVADAQSSRSKAQALADRAAALLFYAALTAGAVTFVAWWAIGDTGEALERTVSVLVIACPHALGLAIPLVIALSTAMSARQGILVKDRLALERMRTVDAVLFDKTGTLTEGAPAMHDVAAVDGDTDAVLRLAAAVEAESEHPLARAIVAAGTDRGDVPRASAFRSIAGRGVEAQVGGRPVAVGGPALLRERDLTLPEVLERRVAEWRSRGATVLSVIDRGVAGAIALEDLVRPQSRAAVDGLHDEGVRVVMVTGDAQPVADAVADELGVDEVMAEVLPEQKDSKVAELQGRGLRVAMVGDGVNDAPALARADVGIAIGAGTDVAIESAGVVLVSDDPRGVLSVRRLSEASYRKMQQNLAWATGYNVIAIPLAAGAFAWAGIVLPPAVAAALMSLSTIVVAANAQLLRRVDLDPDTIAPIRPGSQRARREAAPVPT
ncbi:MAG: copper-translocating P-type ATPase [Actinomycetota bacterium]